MGRITVAAAVVLALLVVPATAHATAAVQLRQIPLPASSIGTGAQGLALASDSGVVSNKAAALQTSDATASTLAKLGRVSGYALDYGYAASGGAGITDVLTGVEQYKTKTNAKHGLTFWQKEFAGIGSLSGGGFSATSIPFSVPKAGIRDFAYLATYSASDIAPLATVDEYFVENRYVLSVEVSAGTAAAAESLAPALAAQLDARLKLALKGHLKAKAVKLPPKPTPGRPPNGPDLSALALTTSDLAGDVPILKGAQYFVDPTAISDYSVLMQLKASGTTDGLLDQEIEWYPTANAAAFNADFTNAIALSEDPAHTTVVDLSSLGYGARGSVTEGTTASPLSTGVVVFSSGQLEEFVFIAVDGAIGTVDPVTNAATAAADHIKTVLGP